MLVGATPEISDIYTRKNDFFCSSVNGFLRFGYQRSNRRVTTLTARQRNGAIRAEIVTSVLHLQKTARAIVLAIRVMEIIHLTDGREVDI